MGLSVHPTCGFWFSELYDLLDSSLDMISFPLLHFSAKTSQQSGSILTKVGQLHCFRDIILRKTSCAMCSYRIASFQCNDGSVR